MRVLYILTQTPGLSYYRCYSFTKHFKMEVDYWPEKSFDRLPNWEEVMMKDRNILYGLEKKVVQADVIVCQRVMSPAGMALLMGLKDKFDKKIFVEVDDDVFNVDSSNPGFASVHPGSIAVQMFTKQLEFSDGVITSTEHLAKKYKEHNKNIHVVKNSINIGMWDKIPKKKSKKIKIGWQGASHHFYDLQILTSVIPKILKAHNVEFHFIGLLPDFLNQEGTVFHSHVGIKDYPKMMGELGLSIMLAPLHDVDFNRGKSNLRVLEAGAMKLPIVASGNKNLPYANTINNGVNGLLADTEEEWFKAIDLLIRSKNLRETLGTNLYKTVKKDYNIKDEAKKYERILRGKE